MQIFIWRKVRVLGGSVFLGCKLMERALHYGLKTVASEHPESLVKNVAEVRNHSGRLMYRVGQQDVYIGPSSRKIFTEADGGKVVVLGRYRDAQTPGMILREHTSRKLLWCTKCNSVARREEGRLRTISDLSRFRGLLDEGLCAPCEEKSQTQQEKVHAAGRK